MPWLSSLAAGEEEEEAPSLRDFLRTAKPEWTQKELEAIEEKLALLKIASASGLIEVLLADKPPRVRLNELLLERGFKPFTSSTVSALRAQAQKSEGPKAEEAASEAPPRYNGVGAGFQGDRPFWQQGNLTGPEDETQWFQVLKSVVFAKEVPNKDAVTVGLLQEGQLFEVQPMRALDSDGHPWVELADLSQLQSFNGKSKRAFALISGRHIGLGPLLRGPMPQPQKRAAPESSAAQEEPPARSSPSAPKQVLRLTEISPPPGTATPVVEAQKAVESLVQQRFTVVRVDGVAVRSEPSEGSRLLFRLPQGSNLTAVEETFDGWVRIADDAGWVRRCSRERGELLICIKHCDGLPTLAAGETLVRPGPGRFEVACREGLEARARPERTSNFVGRRLNFGEVAEASSQTYDGWVKLADGSGWLPSVDPDGTVLLRSSLEDEAETEEWIDRVRMSKSVLRWAQNRAPSHHGLRDQLLDGAIQQLQTAKDAEQLRAAIVRARAFGLEGGDELPLAEARLRELYYGPAIPQEESRQQQSQSEEVEDAKAAAMVRLARAAAAGEEEELREAVKHAKACGVPKREIARAHALHSGNCVVAG